MRTGRTIVTVAGFVIGGCSSETVARPPPAPVNWQSLATTTVPDAGVDVVTAKERVLPDVYAAALASPGLSQLGPLLDEDAHFAAPGFDDAHGRTPVVRAHDMLIGAFDDRKVTLHRVWRTPNEQTIEWAMTGNQARDWMGVSASHKDVAFSGLTLLWTKDDGSVMDVHVYLDVAAVKAQLGVGPKDLLAAPVATPPTGGARVFEAASLAGGGNNVAVVKSALDALENSNEPGYLGAMTEDVEVYTPERSQPARGRAEARTYFRTMHRAIAQLDTTVNNAWGVAEFAIVEYSIAGEQLGPIGWIP
jgi:ketosteroid isomerase-like protein